MDITHVLDLTIFLFVLSLSLGIGIYFSFRQKTSAEYIHGKRHLKLLPVCFSLGVSYVSALTIQGIPAEVYKYGIQAIFTVLGIFLSIFLINITFLPLYYELQLSSVYQYLRIRYKSKLPEIVACSLDVFSSEMYIGLVLYATSAAVESVLGFTTAYNILSMLFVCMIYTALGGLRGVVWTDLFQGFIMLSGLTVILLSGIFHSKVKSIWKELIIRERNVFNLIPDPTKRMTIWVFIPWAIRIWVNFGLQTSMVRFTGLPSLKYARISIVVGIICFCLLVGLSIAVGIVILAHYSTTGCGPLATKDIYTVNQILPYYLKNVLNYPGYSGLFIATLVSASLSSISSELNSVITVVWKSILSEIFPSLTDLSDFKQTLSMKILVLIFGILSGIIAFGGMYASGPLFEVSAIVHGSITGPPAAMFLLGASCTFASSFAVVIGSLCSICFLLWLSIGKISYGTVWETASLINDTCFNNSLEKNLSSSAMSFDDHTSAESPIDTMLYFYSLSPFAYHTVGLGLSCLVSIVLSWCPLLRNKEVVDPKLLFPFMRKMQREQKVHEDDTMTHMNTPERNENLSLF